MMFLQPITAHVAVTIEERRKVNAFTSHLT